MLGDSAEKERYCWILLVGAPRFELGTPSPPDWCANRAALRSAEALGLGRHRPMRKGGAHASRAALGAIVKRPTSHPAATSRQ